MFLAFKNEVKSIQTAGYIGVRTVLTFFMAFVAQLPLTSRHFLATVQPALEITDIF